MFLQKWGGSNSQWQRRENQLILFGHVAKDQMDALVGGEECWSQKGLPPQTRGKLKRDDEKKHVCCFCFSSFFFFFHFISISRFYSCLHNWIYIFFLCQIIDVTRELGCSFLVAVRVTECCYLSLGLVFDKVLYFVRTYLTYSWNFNY